MFVSMSRGGGEDEYQFILKRKREKEKKRGASLFTDLPMYSMDCNGNVKSTLSL